MPALTCPARRRSTTRGRPCPARSGSRRCCACWDACGRRLVALQGLDDIGRLLAVDPRNRIHLGIRRAVVADAVTALAHLRPRPAARGVAVGQGAGAPKEGRCAGDRQDLEWFWRAFHSQYTNANSNSHTTSTNCQYQEAAWNANWSSGVKSPRRARVKITINMVAPTATCTPWNPVSMKNVAPYVPLPSLRPCAV